MENGDIIKVNSEETLNDTASVKYFIITVTKPRMFQTTCRSSRNRKIE